MTTETSETSAHSHAPGTPATQERTGQDRCPLCAGACRDADLAPLLTPQLLWLWQRVAATADRRKDPHMVEGSLQVTAPADAAERAAAVGLLGGRSLAADRGRRVDLAELTQCLRARGPALTPGAVAAHAVGRELAHKARLARARLDREDAVLELLHTAPVLTGLDHDELASQLRRTGWLARVLVSADPHELTTRALRVVAALPTDGGRVDRRLLAEATLDDPHGIDDGQPVAAAVLGLLRGAGRTPPGLTARRSWAHVGVSYDNLTGGLLLTGVAPAGWSLPPGATVTVPPRELEDCSWPQAPAAAPPVFVTENPSVLAAVTDAWFADDGWGPAPRMVCTSGTPSASEVAALGRLAEAGWTLRVRADFDAAGLQHVRALLDGVPRAQPWRMSAGDYLECVRRSPTAPALTLPPRGNALSPWDPALEELMRQHGMAGYEESLLSDLVDDLRETSTPSVT